MYYTFVLCISLIFFVNCTYSVYKIYFCCAPDNIIVTKHVAELHNLLFLYRMERQQWTWQRLHRSNSYSWTTVSDVFI